MIKLSKETLALLEDIEARIDPETEEDYVGQWRDFLYNRFEGDIFSAVRKKTSAPSVDILRVDNINDALEDYDNMLRHQLQGVSDTLGRKHGNLVVRANYGTGILSSLFGAEIFVMPRHTNTLPTTRAFNDTELIRAKVEAGMPDIMGGFGKQVFEFGEICAEVFEKYPKIKKYVKVYHPDLQGPLDICELLWGGEIFYAMYDEPELVHAMLRLVTDTYIEFIEKWFKMFPPSAEMNPHWGMLWHRGAITLRNDSAMNLSPALYREYAMPYDGELLARYGGAEHFCGRGDHYIELLSTLPGLNGVQMSQPHLNDMEIIYKNTVDKGIKLMSLKRDVAERDLSRPGGFRHNLSV
jgi:hypothetical protein